MTKLLTPKLDLVFKSLFSQDTELLVDLINAVLNRPDKERITSVELLNPIRIDLTCPTPKERKNPQQL